jgi:hypothetical protein
VNLLDAGKDDKRMSGDALNETRNNYFALKIDTNYK